MSCMCSVFSNADIKLLIFLNTEAALQRYSYEKVFWKYAETLQENIYAEV